MVDWTDFDILEGCDVLEVEENAECLQLKTILSTFEVMWTRIKRVGSWTSFGGGSEDYGGKTSRQ